MSGSSRPILPSSTSIITAVAVNCFPTDPDWKMLSGLDRNLQFHVRQPEPFGPQNLAASYHEKRESGDVLALHLRLDVFRHSSRGRRGLCTRGTDRKQKRQTNGVRRESAKAHRWARS